MWGGQELRGKPPRAGAKRRKLRKLRLLHLVTARVLARRKQTAILRREPRADSVTSFFKI